MAMSLEIGSHFSESELPARDLRDENAHLRQMLKKANELAARTSMMLREGNHRIKNSLQIVASLMSMQASLEATLSAEVLGPWHVPAIITPSTTVSTGRNFGWISL